MCEHVPLPCSRGVFSDYRLNIILTIPLGTPKTKHREAREFLSLRIVCSCGAVQEAKPLSGWLCRSALACRNLGNEVVQRARHPGCHRPLNAEPLELSPDVFGNRLSLIGLNLA